MTRPDEAATEAQARADWERRVYQRVTDTAGADGSLALPAPANVTAAPGAGHVVLDWDLVPGAAGYVIERTGIEHTGKDGEGPKILAHGGSDVLAVPAPPFADTGLADTGLANPGVYRYRVGAVAGAEYPVWSWSAPVRSATRPGDPGPVQVRVDASAVTGTLNRVWRMVGSERLSQLLLGSDEGGTERDAGKQIAAEFADALRLAHEELGATMVRAHAILHDDNAVASRDAAGVLQFDFGRVDAIYDRLLGYGLRPVVELSFMPAALARDPRQTVFAYRGIISPPADWAEWRQLVTALAGHLVQRYGIDEVAGWAFEVWNEPNLAVFWPGTMAEYLRLYEESARAVKAVDPRLRVGGPATAAAEWIEPLAVHAAAHDVPLDFVSTHTYGNIPLDVRPALQRHGMDGLPVWWTEWGVGSTHFGPVHDGPFGAPFVLSGFLDTQRRLDALAYWVISDHFEELGRPPRLFHNGFGLLTVGNLRKPRYWAVYLAAQLGDQVLATTMDGDGAGSLVRSMAARRDDGTVDVLVWNGTVNAALLDGDPRLDRDVRLTVTGLDADADRYEARLARVDHRHSNPAAHCPADVDWPDERQWARLRDHDELHEETLPDVVTSGDGSARFEFRLPMPGVARIRLSAGQQPARPR